MLKRIENPSITVIMSSVGCHQDEIGRAIRSFLNQTYRNALLLIINWHPQRLVLRGVSDDDRQRIIIHEVDDFCVRPLEFIKYGLKKVCTDTWTVLDDDDWLEPNHLEQLVGCWNSVSDLGDKPLRVCVPHFIAHYEDGEENIDFNGWTSSLFATLSAEEVDLIYKNFPSNLICGSDTWIVSNSYWDKRDFHLPPTFHWTRIGSKHISAHESRPREGTKQGRFLASLNFWRIKLDAINSELEEVFVPQSLCFPSFEKGLDYVI